MPMIDVKTTVQMSEEKKDILKTELGQAISVMGKPESYLMVGIEGEKILYFGGKKLDKGAFVQVNVLGTVNSAQSEKMSGRICGILEKEFGIPKNNVYITYQGYENWGWNGTNF